ncbi:peptidoglycan-binding domain-containing protein [Kitasatospora sp. NPDC054939]
MKLTHSTVLRGSTLAAASALLLALAAPTATANPNARYIRYGDSGRAVQCVQHALNEWNYDFNRPSDLAEDGVFGKNTLNMVKYFQGIQGLDADGVVGPRTGNYLVTELEHLVWWMDCGGYIPTLR